MTPTWFGPAAYRNAACHYDHRNRYHHTFIGFMPITQPFAGSTLPRYSATSGRVRVANFPVAACQARLIAAPRGTCKRRVPASAELQCSFRCQWARHARHQPKAPARENCRRIPRWHFGLVCGVEYQWKVFRTLQLSCKRSRNVLSAAKDAEDDRCGAESSCCDAARVRGPYAGLTLQTKRLPGRETGLSKRRNADARPGRIPSLPAATGRLSMAVALPPPA